MRKKWNRVFASKDNVRFEEITGRIGPREGMKVVVVNIYFLYV